MDKQIETRLVFAKDLAFSAGENAMTYFQSVGGLIEEQSANSMLEHGGRVVVGTPDIFDKLSGCTVTSRRQHLEMRWIASVRLIMSGRRSTPRPGRSETVIIPLSIGGRWSTKS